MADTECLADYEDEPEVAVPSSTAGGASAAANGKGGEVTDGGQKKDYAGIHSSGFRYVPASCLPCLKTRSLTSFFLFFSFFSFFLRDFLLKQELLRAISDLGFEHPSEG